MYAYDTVSEAVNGLRERGYEIDFNLANDCIECQARSIILKPQDFEITEVHRFEGISDPADEAVVYAIQSKYGDKGVLVNGFGVSADSLDDQMIQKLHFRRASKNN